jgi:hypothetical protein
MHSSPQSRYQLVWAEMREVMWLFSATALLSIGAVALGVTLALF